MTRLTDWPREQADAYRAGDTRPLGGYLGALAMYGGVSAAAGVLAKMTGRSLPERVSPWDVALLGVATHKLSRLLSKDAVTSPLRAPFVRYADTAGDAELKEEVREHGGVKHAVGELLTCPFCLAQWVGTTFVFGWLFAPRATRLAEATFAGVAASDFLQLAYATMQQKAEG
jgi:hypothetical protein